MWYNLSGIRETWHVVQPLSQRLRAASSPGRGAIGKEVKFTECQGLSYQERCHRRGRRGCTKESLPENGKAKTETRHVVQPLSHRFAMPAPLVGEPLARRRSLRNAKASPTRRGVTAGDGEVARRKACRKTVKQNGNVSCGTTSQSALTRCQLPWEERRHRR